VLPFTAVVDTAWETDAPGATVALCGATATVKSGGWRHLQIFNCDCGGRRRRVVTFVSDRAQAMEILQKLGLPIQAPRIARARARGPPCQDELFDRPSSHFAADPIYKDG
jgi:hypothetical protein